MAADRESLLQILNRAKDLEKMAENNAHKIQVDLEVNGYADRLKKIELDEVKHYKIVEKLISFVE